MTFSPEARSGHRIRVKGVIMLNEPTDGVYLQEGKNDSGYYIVEVAGFEGINDSGSPPLRDVALRPATLFGADAVSPLSLAHLGSQNHEGSKVVVEATVVHVEKGGTWTSVGLESEHGITWGSLRTPLAPRAVELGTRLRVTGLARYTRNPRSAGPSAVNVGALMVLAGVYVALLRAHIRHAAMDRSKAKVAAESASNTKTRFRANRSHEIRTPPRQETARGSPRARVHHPQ